MRILVTGADGFIGKNLRFRLQEAGHRDIACITRESTAVDLSEAIARTDFVFHLAGVNRPKTDDEFARGNAEFTERVCEELLKSGRRVPVVFSSSIQVTQDNPYGRSKLVAEAALSRYSQATGASLFIFRLTNVFGKWARPNYNSVVATFCYNVSRGLPINVMDTAARLRLVHVDDVADAFLACLKSPVPPSACVDVAPVYETTVGEVADLVRSFSDSRSTLVCPPVGVGLVRALYATYVSYLPVEAFAYQLPKHSDPRGIFAEMLKTPNCGQFSYFTAHPGVTRGEHYHHSKTEKFLVVHGTARFRFRAIQGGESRELVVRGGEGTVVDSVPGWAHDITNIGSEELIVLLWANEIFDRSRPDTIPMKVVP